MPRRPGSYSVREAVNENEVQAALIRATKGYGGVVKFARQTGFTREYVGRMLYGGERMNAKVADALGYELKWVKRGSDLKYTEQQTKLIAGDSPVMAKERTA